jgi:hypothetical protein
MLNRIRQLWTIARASVGVIPKITGKLVGEHKAIRRGVLLWTCYLVTHATHKVFANPIAITTPEAAAYATVTALLGVAIAFYSNSRKQEPPK